MKDKSKLLLIIAIIAITAIIAYVCYGALKGEKKPVVTMEMSYLDNDGNKQTGTVKIELNPEVAPETVANFVKLANNGFYNNLTFHRMVTDFMIQGGDKKGDGTGSASLSDLDKKIQAGSTSDYTYSIKGEFSANGVNNNLKSEKGVIGMARSDFSTYGLTSEGYNSGSSQFFIVTTDNQETLNSLNGSYTAFGKVIEGYDVIEKIASTYAKTESTSPTEETTKLSVTQKDDNDVADNNDVKEVKLTLSKALNKDNVPEGWALSDDGLTLTKTMQKEAVEKLELTATDGEKLNYIVISGKDNVPVMTNVTVDTFGADYGMPDTINYDEVQQKVQQYQNYYQQLMSSYSNSSSTTTDGSGATTQGK